LPGLKAAAATGGLPTIPGKAAEEQRSNLFVRSRTPAKLALLRASKGAWHG